jgi:hypothetical protein
MLPPRAICQITIRGLFNLDWADYIGEALVDVQVQEGRVSTTTLISHPIDLAALLGILQLLVDRGYPVTALEYRHANPTNAVTPPHVDNALS